MKNYVEPIVNLLYLDSEDIIRTSIDNDNCESDIFGEEGSEE